MFRLTFQIFFLCLIITGCKTQLEISEKHAETYIISDRMNATIDSATYVKILPYRQSLEKEMSRVLARTEHAMVKGNPESTLGNFVADACMQMANTIYRPSDGRLADFIFLNTGGLRKSLPEGKITTGDIFELMPFENKLVVLTLTGAQVRETTKQIARLKGAPVSGITFSIDGVEAKNIMINGAPLEDGKIYKAVTSDYLAKGGDGHSFPADIIREDLGLKVRDALISYLEMAGLTGETISAGLEGRIIRAE